MQIKPCPFCGGKGRISFKDYAFYGRNEIGDKKQKYRVQVICNRCKSRGKPIITDWLINPNPYCSDWWIEGSRNETQTKMFEPYVKEAVEAWNTRVGDDDDDT